MRSVRTSLTEIPVGRLVVLPRECRCGSVQGRLFVIHEGQSTRLDCQICGRTHSFPRWDPQGTTPAIVSNPTLDDGSFREGGA